MSDHHVHSSTKLKTAAKGLDQWPVGQDEQMFTNGRRPEHSKLHSSLSTPHPMNRVISWALCATLCFQSAVAFGTSPCPGGCTAEDDEKMGAMMAASLLLMQRHCARLHPQHAKRLEEAFAQAMAKLPESDRADFLRAQNSRFFPEMMAEGESAVKAMTPKELASECKTVLAQSGIR